jgi:hypothetical protein
MYKSLQYIGATILIVVFTLLIMFTLINFMLGCESWDEQYWTAYNSCLTPTEFIRILLP